MPRQPECVNDTLPGGITSDIRFVSTAKRFILFTSESQFERVQFSNHELHFYLIAYIISAMKNKTIYTHHQKIAAPRVNHPTGMGRV